MQVASLQTINTLELHRANAEFRLLVSRKPIQNVELFFQPDHALPTLDVWLDNATAKHAFPFCGLVQDEVRPMARVQGNTYIQ
ncbi:hypothetical protein MRX96_004568 [Rhipicephalus microplus]